MLSPAQIEDLKGRVDLVSLAEQLGAKLRRSGRHVMGTCPICGGGKRATRFEVKGPAWVCAVCGDGGDAIKLIQAVTGCDFLAAVERLGGARPLTREEEERIAAERERREAKRQAEQEHYRQKEIEAARLIYDRGKTLQPGGAISRYFAARNCDGGPGLAPGLRGCADVPYFHGETLDEAGRKSPRVVHRGPALLSPIYDNDGAFSALHITWLRADFTGKAEIVDPDTGEVLLAKKVRGSMGGGHIVIRGAADRPKRLFMGEGIETVYSVATALHRCGRLARGDLFWSSVSLGNLGGRATATVAHPTLKGPTGRPQRIPGPVPDLNPVIPSISIPASIEQLVLLGDGDSDPFLTKTTLERGRARYARDGLRIGIAMAEGGRDFNDMLEG
ncbi:DNA primase [Rhodomicrobium udaipurense JA643]|uniref:DNA primase n=1 Tax=Rhodomicrobium udaipurense TaxID=1202716 RepID=A0A8I1GG36_9HYPH|nr:CHC2 zinc finger domain-containing protein [Rhodomicrobium udaipurense]KAI93290.1 DNA primase [Rhodomicrobium udaipurense JA643]MBJ7543241.1 DNA primase [Rhodomicrobium udaipurense]